MTGAGKGSVAATSASVQSRPAETPGEAQGELSTVPSESEQDHFINFKEGFSDGRDIEIVADAVPEIFLKVGELVLLRLGRCSGKITLGLAWS